MVTMKTMMGKNNREKDELMRQKSRAEADAGRKAVCRAVDRWSIFLPIDNIVVDVGVACRPSDLSHCSPIGTVQ